MQYLMVVAYATLESFAGLFFKAALKGLANLEVLACYAVAPKPLAIHLII